MITIDEQIEWAKRLAAGFNATEFSQTQITSAILATLERVKAAEAGLPVEPVELIKCGLCGLHDVVFKKDYDTLQSALQVAQQERDADISPCCQDWHTCQRRCAPLAENWRMTAKEAEERNKRLVELLREPSADMCAAYYDLCRREDTLAIGASNAWKAMSAELLREVNK